MIYYFTEKYFPPHKNKLPYMKYITFCNLRKSISLKLGGGFSNY
jgi:hypothetical protein